MKNSDVFLAAYLDRFHHKRRFISILYFSDVDGKIFDLARIPAGELT